MSQEARNELQLVHMLESYGISCSKEQAELMLKHLALVSEKNKVMNLTRIVSLRDALIRHVVDSLLLIPSLETAGISEGMSFLDIGTGAGFPGVPLGVMTGMKGTLLDSVGKKAMAVQEFIEELGMSGWLRADSSRAEELALIKPHSFNLVVARAVAPLGVLLEYASPLVKQGGHAAFSKAHIGDDELQSGAKTASLTGFNLVSRETYELPDNSGYREIFLYKKDNKSIVKLPRRTGLAKSSPLA